VTFLFEMMRICGSPASRPLPLADYGSDLDSIEGREGGRSVSVPKVGRLRAIP